MNEPSVLDVVLENSGFGRRNLSPAGNRSKQVCQSLNLKIGNLKNDFSFPDSILCSAGFAGTILS